MQTTQNQRPKSHSDQDDEYLIDFSKLLNEIRRSWRFLFAIIASSAICALLLTFAIPKRWEASATIQIGKIPSSNPSDQSLSIEEPSQTVERIKLREFRENVLTKMGLPLDPDEDKRTELLLNSLKGLAVKGTDFVNVSAEGYNTDEASTTLKLVNEEIQTEHKLLAQSVKTRLTNDLAVTKERILATTNEVSTIKNQLTVSGAYNGKSAFEPSIVAINLLSAKEGDLEKLKTQENMLSMQINDFETKSTKVINKIQVSKRAVYPKRSIFIGIGAFLGGLLGMMILLFRLPKKPN